MRSFPIIKIQIPADRDPSVADAVVGAQVHLFVLHRPPQSLRKEIVPPRTAAVHADADLVPQQQTGEFGAGELAALVGVEEFRRAVPGERFFNRFKAEFRLQRDR